MSEIINKSEIKAPIWDRKQFFKQKAIIENWVLETQKAFNIENLNDVTDAHIVGYLAQKQLGFHTSEDL